MNVMFSEEYGDNKPWALQYLHATVVEYTGHEDIPEWSFYGLHLRNGYTDYRLYLNPLLSNSVTSSIPRSIAAFSSSSLAEPAAAASRSRFLFAVNM